MIYMDVDAALSEVPVNSVPLLDDGDFKTIETAVAYDAAGMTLNWHFVTTAGGYSVTAVTPTTGGTYDWAHQGQGMYSIEIPASGGASINNDTEGYGYFTGVATGVLPWRGPTITFRASGLNDLLVDSAYSTTRGLAGTALPAVASGSSGAIITAGTGTAQLSVSSGRGAADVQAVDGDTGADTSLKDFLSGLRVATVTDAYNASTDTTFDVSGVGFAFNQPLRMHVCRWTTGNNVGLWFVIKSSVVSGNDSLLQEVTLVSPLIVAPSTGDKFILFGNAMSDIQTTKFTTSAGAAGYMGLDWGNITAKTTTNALTGTTISTSQVAASVTAGVTLADDAITASKFDESTAFPLKSADSGATYIARTGADSDTLETLSDQIDGVGGGSSDWTSDEKTVIKAVLGIPASGTTPDDPTTGILDTIRDAVGVVDGVVDSILDDTGTAGVVVASGSKTGYSLTSGTGLGNQTADITGSLSGSVGSVTGDVGGKVLGGGSGTITGAGVTALLSNGTGTGQVSYLGNGILNVNTERVNGTVQTAANIPGLLGTLAGAAATGDPDTAKTVLQYLKQIVNILAGSDGIATFPSAAAPGNAVSLAEAVRQIYTDLQTLDDYVDTEIAAIKAKTDTIPASPAATGDIPSAAANASAVRTELTTELGHIDADISSRLASASYTEPLDAAGTRTAIGLASANLDTQLDALPTAAENATAVAAQVTTDHGSGSYVRNTEPLDAAGVRSAVGLSSANLDTQLSTIDTVVDSILADTGTDGVVLSTTTLQSIADTLLQRNVSNVESTAGEHTLATIVLAMLESARSGTTWTIKRTDGSTTHATKTLTVDADADPITGVT